MKPVQLLLLILVCAFLLTSCASNVDVAELSRQLSAANDALGAYVQATK